MLHVAIERTKYMSRQVMLGMCVPEALHLFLNNGADPNITLGARGEQLSAIEIVHNYDRWAQENGP